MVLNFTDPFLTTRVLGFESLFDRLQRLSESHGIPINVGVYRINFQTLTHEWLGTDR